MNNLFSKVKNTLEDSSVKHEFIKLPDEISLDVSEHMRFHGKDLRYAMPNIVLKTEKGLVVVQRRGDSQIDNKKLKKILGVQRLSLANEEELKKHDLLPGIVPPLGYEILIYMDNKVLENQEIYTGTGDRLLALKINPNDLLKINKATVADFTQFGTQSTGRVLSGIRATGKLHLGNYLGAVKGFLELQKNTNYQTFYMVVDLHTITTPYDKGSLNESVRNIIIEYLACGLDPDESTIFIQSMVPEHIELAYLFSTIMSVARMQHLPTYKEKVKQYPGNVTMALLNYPVLMAADILIYKADLVPVGVDQEPHLEIAREIARKINEKYALNLPQPERFATPGEYVPSLLGEGKMSKTIEGSYINISDNLETIKEKLAKAPTDEGRGSQLPKVGGVAALLKFVELFQGLEKRKEYEKHYQNSGIGYKQLKEELALAIYKELQPIQNRIKKLKQNPQFVEQVIKQGAKKASKVAQETLKEVKKAMGIDYFQS